jgi:transcriptional regulator with XRE-family HTH domain
MGKRMGKQIVDREIIARLMRKEGMNQACLADLTELRQSHISMILAGKVRSPTYHTLRALAKALNVPIERITRRERQDEQRPGEGNRITAEEYPV